MSKGCLKFKYITSADAEEQSLVLVEGDTAKYVMFHILGFSHRCESKEIFNLSDPNAITNRLKMYANQCSGILGASERVEGHKLKKQDCLLWRDLLLQLHSRATEIKICSAKLEWVK